MTAPVYDADYFRQHTGSSGLLNLRGETVVDAHLVHLREVPGLKSLWLSHDITDDGLVHIAALTGLTTLALEDNVTITNAGLAHLACLTNLQVLNLKGTKIDHDGLRQLVGLTKLEKIQLRGSQANQAITAGIFYRPHALLQIDLVF